MGEILLYGLLAFFAGLLIVGLNAYEIVKGKPDKRFLGFSGQILGTYVGLAFLIPGFLTSLVVLVLLITGH